MIRALDSSVIIAALDGSDPSHAGCRKLILSGKFVVFSHALSETFSTLTGGSLGMRLSAKAAATVLRDSVAPRLKAIQLTEADLLGAYEDSSRRGIRGGAIYDYLHLVAARKAGADELYTLNATDFQSFQRPGDPAIVQP